jgi:hypothetical protein
MFDVGNEGLAVLDLMEASVEVDKELVNYLEHVSFCGGFGFAIGRFFYVLPLPFIFTHGLALLKDLVMKRSREATL